MIVMRKKSIQGKEEDIEIRIPSLSDSNEEEHHTNFFCSF